MAFMLLAVVVSCAAGSDADTMSSSSNANSSSNSSTGPHTGQPGNAGGLADRGVGGTGIRPEDRGIGGTGIVGVITGFGSVWVNGLEVELDAATPVRIGDQRGSNAGLRIGQRAVIEAVHAGKTLQAKAITIRYEVSGPIEIADLARGSLRVAGQTVTIAAAAGKDDGWKAGDWVDVSGIINPAGEIIATRLDRRLPGRVTIHGLLSGSAALPRIGQLPLRPVDGLTAVPGEYVEATGQYVRGLLVAETLSEDTLAVDPAGRFGGGTRRLSLDTYVRVVDHQLQLGQDLQVNASPGLIRSIGSETRRAVVNVERKADGSLFATRVYEPGSNRGGRDDGEGARSTDGDDHDPGGDDGSGDGDGDGAGGDSDGGPSGGGTSGGGDSGDD
jgi:hypothetical protein